jgi:hypothetical protein
VGCGPAEERVLLTGLHAVADIYCENCKTTLGWKYVSTTSLGGRASWVRDAFFQGLPSALGARTFVRKVILFIPSPGLETLPWERTSTIISRALKHLLKADCNNPGKTAQSANCLSINMRTC